MYTTGHMAIAIAFRKEKGLLFLIFCMFLTMIPDIDFLLGIEHHTITHSIFFCFFVSFLFSRLFKGQFLYFFLLTISHLILDMMCLDTIHYGIQLFWPYKGFFQFPWHRFPDTPIFYAESLELIFMIILLIITEWIRISNRLNKVVSTYVINLWRH